jgi:V/A-type H+-transporting ATPase subunit C
VKARKAFLFPRETYMKLLQMSVPEISRFIEESKYKREVDELATRYGGIDLMEYALSLNMAREMNDILSFCKGDLREYMGAYLMRWDVWNVKSILRGKYSGATDEEIRETLVPAGDIGMQQLIDIIRKGSIPDVIDSLSGTIFYKPLLGAMDEYNTSKTISTLENIIDKVYYAHLLALSAPGSKADKLFIDLLKKEIDVTNLRTLFRCKRGGLEHDKIMEFLIPGGSRLGMDMLQKMAQAPSFDEFTNILKDTPYWTELSDAMHRYQETKSLNEVEIALQKYLIAYGEKISHMYPLSICPIIGYAIRKYTEVANIRTIARGKEMHLPDDVIKSMLVI